MQTIFEENLTQQQVGESDLPQSRLSWLDRPVFNTLALNAEVILFAVILILAVGSRFYDLGSRVMSHDENSHVYYSWKLYKGQGFSHDPLMHGPLQFQLIALSYFLFGDNDFTARLPHILFSIATVAFLWFYRRYLGRTGTLVAAALMLISPYMLFYGRYARNEAFVALFGVVTLWAILRYLETGQARYMYWLTAATVLHFTVKETSFIYTAQALLFLAFFLIYRLARNPWPHPQRRNFFLLALTSAFLLLGGAGILGLLGRSASGLSPGETLAPSVPGQELAQLPSTGISGLPLVLLVFSLVALLVAAYFLIRGYTWSRLRSERSFDLLILIGTLVLPHLSAFFIRFAGWDIPTNASEVIAMTTTDMVHMAIFLAPLALISILVGLWWNPRQWLINAGIFYAIFTVFYTTIFTNGAGFFTGLVGSLGYWLEQQGVNRGNQPWYYYAFIQMPVYEYLPLLGSLFAFGLAVAGKRAAAGRRREDHSEQRFVDDGHLAESGNPEAVIQEHPPVLSLLGFWSVTSLVAYTIAGEKMPWLTVHITLPMILLAGWAIGYLIETTDWIAFKQKRAWIIILLLPVFLFSILASLSSIFGPQPPFQGKDLNQLSATSTFLTSFLVAVASGAGLYYLVRPWAPAQFNRLVALFIFAILGVLTARTAVQAAYINYDNANELLVYAHSAPGDKIALAQIEEISRRTTNGLALVVAYDDSTSYPFLWYLRNYPNARYFGADPTRSLREAQAILAGDDKFTNMEPVVGQAYNQFDYIRLWWPNQEYFNLTWDRILYALRDPQWRAAIFQIWLNRDYTLYGQALGQDLSLPNWSPSERMRLYIRKDIIGQLWNYGVPASTEPIQADPYEGKEVKLVADNSIGIPGSEPGQFQGPRDLVVAPDGSLYVADTGNHRIQHLAPDGSVLQVWGSFADILSGPAPEGTMNQPWGIAIGPDGSVYVADTWNYRIQKFTADGQFIRMWGYFGQAEAPDAFWGPRDVAVDSEGRVFVADTWNQRIQVFVEDESGTFQPEGAWDVVGWYGQSLDNKPYLVVGDQDRLFVTDPEGVRVLEFTKTGEFIRYWGDRSAGLEGFGLAASVSIDPQGGVWVSDAGNNRVMHFSLPVP